MRVILAAYVPSSINCAALVVAILAANVVWGFTLSRLPTPLGRLLAWLTVVGGVGAVHVILLGEPAGFRMLALKVTATSSEQPNVTLTVEGFGEMVFKKGKYELKKRPVANPGTVTVTSSSGGTDSSTIKIR